MIRCPMLGCMLNRGDNYTCVSLDPTHYYLIDNHFGRVM